MTWKAPDTIIYIIFILMKPFSVACRWGRGHPRRNHTHQDRDVSSYVKSYLHICNAMTFDTKMHSVNIDQEIELYTKSQKSITFFKYLWHEWSNKITLMRLSALVLSNSGVSGSWEAQSNAHFWCGGLCRRPGLFWGWIMSHRCVTSFVSFSKDLIMKKTE